MNYVKVVRAMRLAIDAHEWDTDKEGLPAIYHPLAVFGYVEHLEPKFHVLALLHDVVEDTGVSLSTIENIFGEEIKESIDALTQRKEEETYFEYIDRCVLNKDACVIKEADIRHNLLKCWSNIRKYESMKKRYDRAYDRVNEALDDFGLFKF